MKQQTLKEQRNYRLNPRRDGEIDPDYRNDLGDFDESRTKQADAEGADINVIMKRFSAQGLDMNDIEIQFNKDNMVDVSDAATYHEAQNIIAQGNSLFHALPAHVRAEFKNSPEVMLEYIDAAHEDPKKVDKLLELGLARKREPAPEREIDVLRRIDENLKQPKKKQAPDSGALKED